MGSGSWLAFATTASRHSTGRTHKPQAKRDIENALRVARGLATGGPAGRVRFVTSAGSRQFQLRKGGSGRPASLVAAAGRPSVRVSGRTVEVAGLPAGTGIVEVTVYQPRPPRGPRLLRRDARPTVRATLAGNPSRRLTARVAAG